MRRERPPAAQAPDARALALLAISVARRRRSASTSSTTRTRAFPGWMPLIGDDPDVIEAELPTAQGVIPGQGQLVEVAGVVVGRVSSVRHERGRAILDLHMERDKVRLFRDASILLRPRTLLKDMILQLTPGTPAAGELPAGDRIPVANTLPDVNVDELLSALDADTRGALVALAQGAARGSTARARARAGVQALRPDHAPARARQRRDGRAAAASCARRRRTSRGSRDARAAPRRPARFVGSSNAVLGAIAAEQRGVRETLRELPATLRDAQRPRRALTPVARSLGQRVAQAAPGRARARPRRGGAWTRPVRQTAPVMRDRAAPVRPRRRGAAARAAPRAPTASPPRARGARRPRASSTASSTTWPATHAPARSYVFWAAWAAHHLNSVLSGQDALGPYAHTLTLTSCESLRLLPGLRHGRPGARAHLTLGNLPKQEEVCR